MAMYPNLQKLPYAPESYVSVFRVMQDYTVLWTHKYAPWKDFKSMAEYIRKHPGKYMYATSGGQQPGAHGQLLLFRSWASRWSPCQQRHVGCVQP
jgi:tripartite-type tricarboxylate transporter receptor subunit TctC